MTPESIPGLLIHDELRSLLHLGELEGPVHHGPVYEHHELFLTDLSRAA
jgi:hypothetical protein